MTPSLSLFALAAAQLGVIPGQGVPSDIPEELRDRPPPRSTAVAPRPTELEECLRLASSEPGSALDLAQRWRDQAVTDLDLTQSAHCLGLALVQLGRFSEARQAFELASGEAPDDNLAYSARLSAMAGNAAMAADDPEGALPLLDRAGEIALLAGEKGLAADLRVDLARVLVRLGRSDDAVRALAEAREADPLDVQAWLLSATLSRRLERLGEAQEQIERAATLDPRDPQIGLEAGVIAALSGREEDARRSFASVLDVAPGSREAERAQAYLDQLGDVSDEPESPER